MHIDKESVSDEEMEYKVKNAREVIPLPQEMQQGLEPEAYESSGENYNDTSATQMEGLRM